MKRRTAYPARDLALAFATACVVAVFLLLTIATAVGK